MRSVTLSIIGCYISYATGAIDAAAAAASNIN